MRYFIQVIITLASFLTLSGCAHWLDDAGLRDETILPPAYPIDAPPPAKVNGTIYQPGYEVSLYRDHIAHRIGDILTVKLEETTLGQKQAQMKTDKKSQNNTNNGTTSNNPSTVGGSPLRPVFFGQAVKEFIFNNGSDFQFDGKGQTNQSNKLEGTISVTIVRILSNENMVIQGESWITINQGREYVRLTGIVRPEDIDANNIVSSQRVANARIAYSGAGQVGNTARGGLLTQLYFKFFPY